jgi:hypothetical protein
MNHATRSLVSAIAAIKVPKRLMQRVWILFSWRFYLSLVCELKNLKQKKRKKVF